MKKRLPDYKDFVVHILIFLFPIVVATVKNGGGIIAVILIVLGVIWGWPAWKNLHKWEKHLLFGFILLSMIAGFSLINTENIHEGLSKLERFLYFPLCIPIYLLLRVLKIETGKTLLLGAVVAGFVLLGQALYEINVLTADYAEGAYHKIIFGDIAMILALIIVAAMLTLEKQMWYYFIGIAAVCCAVYASVLSQTRGSWLLLPVALFGLFWLFRHRISRRGWLLAISVSIVIFVVLAGGLNNPVQRHIIVGIDELKAHLEDPSHISSWGERVNMWSDSIRIWKTSPILGTGLGDFGRDSAQLIADNISHLSKPYRHAHSVYFDALATLGLFGLVVLVVCIFCAPLYIFYSFWNSCNTTSLRFYSLSGLIVVVGFAVFGLTEGWLSRSAMVKTYLICLLVFLSSIANSMAKQQQLGSVDFTALFFRLKSRLRKMYS